LVTLLKSGHFRVLHAWNADSALKAAAAYPEKIDLLLSDIEMPGMSGPDLGVALKRTRPDIRVMLMSGFPDGNLLLLNYGWAFIQKPFVPTKQAGKPTAGNLHGGFDVAGIGNGLKLVEMINRALFTGQITE
jgi:DNA-binding NtrC family response regulator